MTILFGKHERFYSVFQTIDGVVSKFDLSQLCRYYTRLQPTSGKPDYRTSYCIDTVRLRNSTIADPTITEDTYIAMTDSLANQLKDSPAWSFRDGTNGKIHTNLSLKPAYGSILSCAISSAWAESPFKVPEYWPTQKYHYAHIIENGEDELLIGFFVSPEHLERARVTTMKPGRYLARYFPELGMEKQRSLVSRLDNRKTMSIAVTGDDIVTVYKHGPKSCMSHPADDYKSHVHPAYVYGNSDLQLAYLGDKEGATARCLIYPDKMFYGRIYGDRERLEPKLIAAGYRDNTFRGARIPAIPCEEANDSLVYVMPYLDGDGHVRLSDDGKSFVICRESSDTFYANNVDGTIALKGSVWCRYTEDYHEEDDMIYIHDVGEYWHFTCIENGDAFICDGTGLTYSSGVRSILTEDGSTYTLKAFTDRDGYYCELSNEYYVDDNGVFIQDIDGEEVLANRRVALQYGYTLDEITGNYVDDDTRAALEAERNEDETEEATALVVPAIAA